MSSEEIDSLLKDIDQLQSSLSRYQASEDLQRLATIVIGVYAVYLVKIFVKTKGYTRNVMNIHGADLLLITYAAAFMKLIGW